MTTTSSSTSSSGLDALTSALNSLSSSATTAGTTTSTTTKKGVSGLASGIDTAALIDAMVAADRASTAQLEKRMQQFEKRLEAVRSLNAKLLTAQLDLSNLKLSGTLGGRNTTSSDEAVGTATASSASIVGSTFSGTVTAVARAHQLATAGQTSASTGLGAGTISLKVGSGSAKTISLDAATSSLNDIAKAINNAGAGVTASVVKQSGANPYRLILTSNSTGADNAITVSADSGNASLAALFSGATTITTASDAALTIGQGASAITLTSASNTFADVAPGVSLTVKKAGDVTVTVGTDSTKAKEAITTFVKDVNDAISYLKDNSGYDSESKSAGVLIQESDLRNGVNQLTRALIASVPGLPSSMNSAAQMGITFNYEKGTFDIDDTKLDKALADNPGGVATLFQNGGTSTSTGVSFGALNSKTKTTTPFQVNITQAAEQATLTGSPLAASTVVDATNSKLSLSVNGNAYTITLGNGTYTQSELVEQLQKSLDAATVDSPSNRVLASLDGSGQVQLRSKNYGSAMSVEVQSGSALAALGLSAARATGKDVKGTINGVAGIGTGQILDGATGGSAEGLTLVISATAPLSGVSVTARKGMAQTLQERLSSLTDVEVGLVTRKTTTYQSIITDQEARITANDERLAQRRKFYEAKFLQMETLTSKYQGLSSYITQFTAQNSSSS